MYVECVLILKLCMVDGLCGVCNEMVAQVRHWFRIYSYLDKISLSSCRSVDLAVSQLASCSNCG